MKTIITTVGTSLFENYKKQEVKDLFLSEKKYYYDKLKDNTDKISEKNPLAKDYANFEIKIGEIEEAIKKTWLVGITKDEDKDWEFADISIKNIYASAEIQSIHKIITQTILENNTETFSIYLLASDTVISLLASNIIKDALIAIFPQYFNSDNIFVEYIEKCNMSNSTIETDEIFQNLITKLNEITIYKQLKGFIKKVKDNGDPNNKPKHLSFYDDRLNNPNTSDEQRKVIQEIKNYIINKPEPKPEGFTLNNYIKSYIEKSNTNFIINIAGGYKGLIPYLTIVAQLWEIPVFYLFEDGESDVLIDKLPIQFDTSIIEMLYPYLDDKYLKNSIQINKNTKAKELLLRYKLVKENNAQFLDLTAFGKLFNQYVTLKDTNAKSVFGFYAEYKFYEYFIENEYQGMSFIKHSKKFKKEGEKNNLHEIDLQLSTEKDGIFTANTEFILIEIKSFFQVSVAIQDIIDTAKKRILFYETTFGKKPKEYILAFYKSDFHDKNTLKSFVDEFIKQVTETNVKVIFTDIKLSETDQSDTNSYINFAQAELTKDKLKEFYTEEPLIP